MPQWRCGHALTKMWPCLNKDVVMLPHICGNASIHMENFHAEIADPVIDIPGTSRTGNWTTYFAPSFGHGQVTSGPSANGTTPTVQQAISGWLLPDRRTGSEFQEYMLPFASFGYRA